MDPTPTHEPPSAAGRTFDQRPAARYAALWHDGRPDLDVFLAKAGPLAPDELTAVLCSDQRHRWLSGERVSLDDYLTRLPGSPPDPDAAADLIFNEFLVREQLGERPTPEEYASRFPRYAPVIRDQVHLHRAIGASDVDSLPVDASHPGTVVSEREERTTGPHRPAIDEPLRPGRSFGDYVLLGEVARGGMGVVYRARQKSLNRVVALKMILAGQFAGSDEVRRFRAEAEAVALLDHPHILPVYEVGERRGRNFFAMKYVDGGSLAKAMERLSRETRSGVEMLVKVCRAVHFAHQRGIIHRDLKPANVMLDSDGTPYVADFGLAKWIEGNGDQTLSGTVVGTPSYIAPEQARAERQLTTAADVYSLGAILYELLTNRPPFKAESTLATLQMVQDEDPLRPSLLNSAVDRDLETIALKCLDKDPARRYGSAKALADELECWLRHEPITARPTPAWERAWKWARRRPAIAALTAALWLVIVFSVLGLAGMYRQSERRRVEAETERDEARAQRQRTRQALDDMLSEESVGWLSTQKKLLPEQRAFLECALAYYQEFATQAGTDEEGRRLEATALCRLASVHSRLGHATESEPICRRAIELYERLVEEFPGAAKYRADLATAYGELDGILDYLGRKDEAVAACRAGLAIRQKLIADFPSVTAYQKGLSNSYHNLGTVLKSQGVHSEAEAAYRSALALSTKLSAAYPKNPVYREDLARTHNNLAVLLDEMGRMVDAEAAYRATLDVLDRLVADYPNEPDYRRLQGGTRGNLGALLADLKRPKEAEEAYRAAVAINDRLSVEYPSVPIYRRTLATNHYNLGNLHRTNNQAAEAEVEYRAAIVVEEKLAADFPAAPAYQRELAQGHSALGGLFATTNRRTEAEAEYRIALAMTEKLLVAYPGEAPYLIDQARVCLRMGIIADAAKDWSAALPWYDRAVQTVAGLASGRHKPEALEYLTEGIQGQAAALSELGRHAEAVAAWDRLLELLSGPQRTAVLARVAFDAAKAGDAGRAATAGEQVVAAGDATADALYNCACGLALVRGVPAADACAARAVDMLRQAVAKGYQDFAHLRDDTDLAPLRDRADFLDLLWDMAEAGPVTNRSESPGS